VRETIRVGVGEATARARDEHRYARSGLSSTAPELAAAGVNGGHAHQHGGARHQFYDHIRIEFRQKIIAARREQRDVARHEQAVGVIDRQRVDQARPYCKPQ
jgi:hypothetical protein